MSSYQPKTKTVNNTYNICTKELTKAGVVQVVVCIILVKDLSQDIFILFILHNNITSFYTSVQK